MNSPYKFTDPLGLLAQGSGQQDDCSCKPRKKKHHTPTRPKQQKPQPPPKPSSSSSTVTSTTNNTTVNNTANSSTNNTANVTVSNTQQDIIDSAVTRMFNLYVDARGSAEKITPISTVRSILDPLGASEVVDLAVSGTFGVSGDFKPLGAGGGVDTSGSAGGSTSDEKLDKNIGNTIQGFQNEIDVVARNRDADLASERQKLTDALVQTGMNRAAAAITSSGVEYGAIMRDNASVVARGTSGNVQLYVDARLGPFNPAQQNSYVNREKVMNQNLNK
jgi:hypothetical protein